MTKRTQTAAGSILAAVVSVCVLLLLGYPVLQVLSIEPVDKSGSIDTRNANRLFIYGLESGKEAQEFVISYTHSVNKGRVKDYYRFKKTGTELDLEMYKTQFLSYGAGMSDPEGNEVFIQTDDYIEINNMSRVMSSLLMAVGYIADHRLEIGDIIYCLSDYFPPQQRIMIRFKKISVVEYLRCLHEQRVIYIQ